VNGSGREKPWHGVTQSFKRPPCVGPVAAESGRAKNAPQEAMRRRMASHRRPNTRRAGPATPGAPYVKFSLSTVKRAIRSSSGV